MLLTFAGHSTVSSYDKIKEIVKEQIRNNIINEKYVACYLGGYGDFDKLCACACRELKKDFPSIEVIYVAPYISLSEQTKIKEMQSIGLYDSSIYPPIESVPPRFAIVKRNEWMITSADLVIVYINHCYGGAYKSFEIAKRKKKRIINVCDFI